MKPSSCKGRCEGRLQLKRDAAALASAVSPQPSRRSRLSFVNHEDAMLQLLLAQPGVTLDDFDEAKGRFPVQARHLDEQDQLQPPSAPPRAPYTKECCKGGNGRPPKCCHYLDGMPEPTMPCCAECVNKPEDTCAV